MFLDLFLGYSIFFFYDNVGMLPISEPACKVPIGKRSFSPRLVRCDLVLGESVGPEAEIFIYLNPPSFA